MTSRTMRRGFELIAAACVIALGASTVAVVAPQAQDSGGGIAASFFTLLDRNKDGTLTRDEMRSTFDGWYTQWDTAKGNALTSDQLFIGVATAFPAPAPGEAGPQNRTPRPDDVSAMIAALPDAAPARPRQPRKVLVVARAAGYVHSSIPLAARTIEEMGKKTGAWSATVTYDAADVNEANLKQYDAIFLASTTGHFLDDPKDAAATAARRKALLDFVRGGKGLAGIHAASDAYHRNAAQKEGAGINFQVIPVFMQLQGADRNGDRRVSRDELAGLADALYDKLDPKKSGGIARADFPGRFAAVPPPPPPPAPAGGGNGQAPATNLAPDTEVGTWPEFNRMFGAFFKWHWNDGQAIPVKIDDPKNPVNAPFQGQGYVIVDETYTFSRNTYSRENLRVLTSIDYAKMSAEDKAKEQNPRPDGDYALSWIRREGKGRVFYEAHGHNEKVYANRLLLQQILAGIQYAIGDLPADDSPSAPAK